MRLLVVLVVCAAATTPPPLFVSYVVNAQNFSAMGDPALWTVQRVAPAYALVSSIVCAHPAASTFANCTVELVAGADPNPIIELLVHGARLLLNRSSSSSPEPQPQKEEGAGIGTWWVILLIAVASVSLVVALVLAALVYRASHTTTTSELIPR